VLGLIGWMEVDVAGEFSGEGHWRGRYGSRVISSL